MCKRGRFNLDNEIRDLTATLLTEVEVCHDISVEPGLQPISNEILTGATANTQDGVRLDIAANGFSECSIPMLRQTGALLSHPATESTSRQRNVCTNKGAERWNMPHLPL